MMTPEEIRRKVQAIVQLPVLPSIASEIAGLADDPRTSASQLGKAISSDQALTAKVLKIANSPRYGFPGKISTIDFAIVVLGYDALKEIIISLSLISSLKGESGELFDSRAFWDHAIASGVLAQRLSRDLGYRVSGEVFVGGLLHDMGISVLHLYFRQEFRRIVAVAGESDLTFLEAEESVLGVTHAEIGGWLAECWNLPDHLVEAIAQHHHPLKARRNLELVSLIHCADVFASRLRKSTFDKGTDFDQRALDRLGLADPGVLNEYLARYSAAVQADVDHMKELEDHRTHARASSAENAA